MKLRSGLKLPALGLILPVALILLWQMAAERHWIDTLFLSGAPGNHGQHPGSPPAGAAAR